MNNYFEGSKNRKIALISFAEMSSFEAVASSLDALSFTEASSLVAFSFILVKSWNGLINLLGKLFLYFDLDSMIAN